MFTTLILAFTCALATCALIAVTAFYLRDKSSAVQQTVDLLIWIPWVIPGVVLSFLMFDLFFNVSVLNLAYGTIIPMFLALVIKELPLMFQLYVQALKNINTEWITAAELTGKNKLSIFLNIALPLTSPTLLLVFVLVFASVVKAVDTIVLLAPPNISTLSLLAFSYAADGNFEAASVVGLLASLLSLFATFAAFWLVKRSGTFLE